MEAAGIFTVLAMLLLAPTQIMQARAQKRRLLSPHELQLRRATQPLGGLALLAWFAWLIGLRDFVGIAAPVLLDPAANWLPALLVGAVLLYGLVSFIAGASQCWGVRSDGMMPFWAFVRFALGVAGLRYLWLGNVDLTRGFDLAPWPVALWLLLVAASIWCAVVSGARFVLLTTGGGNALRQINKHLKRRNAPQRPARRPWWRLWW